MRVNKHVYEVGTAEEQAEFRACGEFRAARRFAKWQAARGKLFGGAHGAEEVMVEALLTEEPRRDRPARPAPDG